MKNNYYLNLNPTQAKEMRVALATRLKFLRTQLGSMTLSMKLEPVVKQSITVCQDLWKELDGNEIINQKKSFTYQETKRGL